MRKALLILLLPSLAWALPPVISPSTPTVYVSSTMQMNADQTVTWSLASGSTGTIDSATGIYTAPGPVRAKNVLLGWPALPNDHVYNTRIDALSVQASSTTYLHSVLSAFPLSFDAAFPENIHTNTTPQLAMTFHYTTPANGNFPVLGLADLGVENGVFTDNQQVDQHIVGVNIQTGQFSEIYGLTVPGGISGCPSCNSGSGIKYSNNYVLDNGVDAAGMFLAPLAVKYRELRDCANGGAAISHALRFTLPIGYLASSYIWPGVQFATDSGAIPFGARMRLKSTFTNTGSATARCIETALKNYGAFAVDGGISMQFQFMQDATGDYDLYQALTAEMPGITGLNSDNFEFVDESGLMESATSGRVKATNGLVTPDHFVTVIASNTTTHLSSTMAVIVQPVTIGTDRQIGYSFLAGSPSTTLNVWVEGSTDTTKTCTMSPSLGTLTSAGVYTPPSTVVSRSSTAVTCVPTMDKTTSVSFPVVVYSTAGVRLSLSEATPVNYGPDVNGNTWFSDANAFWRFSGTSNCDWTASPWTGVTDAGLYKHCEHKTSGSGDVKYKFIVPNGTYQIKLLYAVGGGSPFSAGSWQESIDSQGSIYSASPSTTTLTGMGPWSALGLTGKYFDFCTLIPGCAQQTPATITFNATVTDNNLYFAIRHLAPYLGSSPTSMLTAFSVLPVASAAASTDQKTWTGGFRITGGGVFQ